MLTNPKHQIWIFPLLGAILGGATEVLTSDHHASITAIGIGVMSGLARYFQHSLPDTGTEGFLLRSKPIESAPVSRKYISINEKPFEISHGNHTVSQLKTMAEIFQVDNFCQIIDNEIGEILPNEKILFLLGGETFVSYPPEASGS